MYIPDEVQTRTLTAHFKIAGGEHNGKTIAPDAQVQVLFKKAGTLDTATNKIVYTGNWAPDWDAGDEATPVFHVVSGSWSLPPKGNDASIGLTSPSRDGYTVANIRYDGSYSTFTFANPNYNSNTAYMNNDNDVWYMRNDLTTYYVPNSLLNKSVTRTITIKEPGQADRTITQNAKLSRQVKVNGDDTGVTFEGFDGSGWKADSNWGVQDVPIHAGYNISVTQTVEGASTSTPLQLVNGQIPAETVNGDTKNTQIVVTYGATATATATLGKEGSRDYDAKTTSVADVLSKLGWTDSGFVKNQTLKSTDLTASDYAWFTKNADGTFTAMTGDPINAGTYYLKLKDSSEAKLKAENPNYNLTINGEFTYTINPVSGTATLSGSASKIYDGKDISLDDLNSPDGDIEAKFTFPGSTVADTYKLHAGDYTIENNSAKADDYTVSLSTDGLARLQAAIDNYAGAGNVTLAAKDLSSNASFTIKQKDLTVTLDKKPNTTPGKTYDGQTATIDDNDAQFTAAGLVEGQTLNVANLTPSDYEWVDKDGKKLDKVPTDAGTYYIALTQAGVKQLQKDNPNYKVSESGQFAYVIAKAEAKVEINGSYEGTSTAQDAKIYRNAVVDEVTGKVTYGAWSTGNWGPFTTPTIDGYTPTIASIATKPVTYGTDPESVDITYTPNAQTTNIIYKDEDGQTIRTDKVDGKTDETVDVHSTIPAGWKLVDGQDVPETVKFGPNGHPDIPVVIEHKTITVTPETPEDKIPTGKVPVKTPNETSDDTEIDTTPKDQDFESGPAVIKGYEENNAPLYEDMNNSAPARNNNSISLKGADTYASTNAPAKAASAETEENSGKHELPQTGEKQNEAGIFVILAMVLGLFGLADRKKKKDE